jgi:hypothetical protein
MATLTVGIKRKPLSISEKLNIISKVDGTLNATRTKTAEELGILWQHFTVMYNRNKILKQSLTEQLNRKKIKTAKYESWKQFLWRRSNKNRALNFTVDGPILKRKAEEIATKLNIDLRPRNGWTDRFKKFSGLGYRKLCGGANSVNPEEVVTWKDTTLLHLMAKYSPKDIFNADEFNAVLQYAA